MSFYRNGTLLLAAFLLWAPASRGVTEAQDPSKIDFAKLIECTTYDVPSYNEFAMWLTGPESAKAMKLFGISELSSDNPFLREFQLSAPLTVFGRQTNRVAFASTGPLAVLDEADPHSLAKQLGVTAAVDRPNKFLGEKEILSRKDQQENSDTVLHTRISLNVSTDEAHPGKTLAGCSYSIEVE
ncbi:MULTISPECIES: hypothetical protein [unclassified Rhizobium]|uniref:hypothetical protein n=1 Tax=unclassified Rhizobium TaxID=2613769 RepID=UPI001199F6AC|nr:MULTISPECIES: hypothetical protein [unclassified Rhizobium]MBB3287238.1 hypothetical protein [Rhizobium sp. BK252]MBB3401978.1 hypothetical protein [Rhizobium sp. BK289]MBB3414555.1 hypothetical protein [Rhizobium sp. BK284]MBB3482444.1 hypothetical protein [Rhizobium sp. BK347]